MKITVANRQEEAAVNLGWLRRFARVALKICRPHGAGEGAVLPGLEEVEVTIVSDAVIADVHQKFMNLPGPTDVITFDHGEILIGAGVAAANAADYRRPLDEELALYIIHGLLHLNGWRDDSPEEAEKMAKLQENLLSDCLSRVRHVHPQQ